MRWLIALLELAVLCWFVIVGVEAFWQRLYGLKSPFNLREFHHAFIGAGLVVLGCWLASPTGIFVQLLGVVLTIDDTYQHVQQTLNDAVDYRSPLHELFAAYLWPLPWVPPLVRFFDDWWPVGVVLGLVGWVLA